ncbi:MAG: DUF1150 family protein [Telmatospirillum sp.]|nr:DUF1150 family protein [Telmatospirillum sp.]
MENETHKTPSLQKAMSAQDLALWGIQDIAFVKRVVINDEVCWAIHGADGANIGMAPDRDVAFAAVRQHDLEPVSVH